MSSSRQQQQHLTIHNQRCLLVPSSTNAAPPLLILPGLGQSIASYEAVHVTPSFSRDYPGPILVYEPLGFGPLAAADNGRVICYDNVTFPAQIERLLRVLDSDQVCRQLLLQHEDNHHQGVGDGCCWNVVGYSWGARLAMALSTACPDRIHKLHLTGVALDRSPAGHVAIQAWKDVLLSSSFSSMMDTVTTTAPDKQLRLRAFAWMALQTTYSSEFLYHQQRDKVEGWIQFLIDNNSVSGLGALLEQTYPTDRNDPWHVESMAKRISSQQNKIRGCLLVGDEDVMAPVESARELAAVLSWSPLLHTVESCGHAVPLQKPREWRQHVLDFLSP